jgi:RNA polymerase sigma-70 factor (ECF subfamily)
MIAARMPKGVGWVAVSAEQPDSSYDRFIAPVQSQMVKTIWNIVRDPDETEDCVQDVLLEVFSRLDRIEAHPNPTAFILRMSIHRAFNHLRRRRNRQRAHTRMSALVTTKSAPSSPHEHCSQEEQKLWVLEVLSRLPRREAIAMTLHVVEDLPYPEVAEAMHCRESTARVLVARARKHLRAKLPKTLFAP